ncbi:MAG: hypothetical protein IK004_05090 [Bacteroidales bacterium]|nr:hypothetical protein [Bacteroidales bacterium]
MKKLFLITILLLMTASVFAQEQEAKVRIPSGYQGFFEYGNTYLFDDNPSLMNFSTTHGFYMNGHTYVGIGISIDTKYLLFLLPIYGNVRYVFNNNRVVSPVVGLRLGCFDTKTVGFYGDLTIGLRFATKRDFAISFLISGTHYNGVYFRYRHPYTDEYGIDHMERCWGSRNNLTGISLRLGIEW